MTTEKTVASVAEEALACAQGAIEALGAAQDRSGRMSKIADEYKAIAERCVAQLEGALKQLKQANVEGQATVLREWAACEEREAQQWAGVALHEDNHRERAERLRQRADRLAAEVSTSPAFDGPRTDP